MKRIYIQSIGPGVGDVCSFLLHRLHDIFGMETAALTGIDIPRQAWNPQRRQHYSSALFSLVERYLPPDAFRILGVTDADLYVPQLSFVFGEAKLGGPSAVISIHRLRPEFYGELPDIGTLLRRAEIEAVHEIGHALGLRHCVRTDCVMFFSNNIAASDRKGPNFCADCKSRVLSVLRREVAVSSKQ